MFTIRRASASDAEAIVACITHSFGETASVHHIEHIITAGQNQTYVAVTPRGQVAGFADAFHTTDINGNPRYELDLMAVHPDHRRQGIAHQLVYTCLAYTKHPTRALVACDNTPMQRNIAALGFIQQQDSHTLYVASSDHQPPKTQSPSDAHLIPVDTLTYTGVWLEGTITPQAIHAAHDLCIGQKREVIGTLVSTTNHRAIQTLHEAGFTRINDYHWWHHEGTASETDS